MPVVPDFNSYAPQPNLANAYMGGARIGQDQQRIDLAAQQAAQSLQIQQAKLAQDAQQAQMELMAKKEVAQQQMLRQQQQMEIEKAYKEAEIGLRQQQLQDAGQTLQLKTQEAARRLQVQGDYQRIYQSKVDSGMTSQQASMEAMTELNPANFGGAGTAAVRGQPGAMNFGDAAPVPGLPENFKQVQVGPQQRRIIQMPPNLSGASAPAEEAPGLPGYKTFGGKLVKAATDQDVALDRKRLGKMMDLQDKDTEGLAAAGLERDKKELGPAMKNALAAYKERQKQIEDLRDEITKKSSSATVPHGISTNRIGRFKILTQ